MEKEIKIKSQGDFEREFSSRNGNLKLLEELEDYLSLKLKTIKVVKVNVNKDKEKYIKHEISRANTITQLTIVQKECKKMRLNLKKYYQDFFYVTCKQNLDTELFNKMEELTKLRYERNKI